MTENKEAPLAQEGPAEKHDGHEHDHEHHHHHHKVEVKINGKPYELPEGPMSVKHLKELAGIPLADVLEQVVHGQLQILPDDGSVCIKPHEKFVSHPRGSSSS